MTAHAESVWTPLMQHVYQLGPRDLTRYTAMQIEALVHDLDAIASMSSLGGSADGENEVRSRSTVTRRTNAQPHG